MAVSYNQALEIPKSERITDNAILAFKFQQKCLSTSTMFLHSWLHQSQHLGMV
jgi:hypothetical protein